MTAVPQPTPEPCVECGGDNCVPFSCYGWRRLSIDHAGKRYEGLRTFKGWLCLKCIHRHYKTTYVAAACFAIAFVAFLIYRLAVVGQIGSAGFVGLFMLGLPTVVLGGRILNEDVDKAAAYYIKRIYANDGINGTGPGNGPVDMFGKPL